MIRDHCPTFRSLNRACKIEVRTAKRRMRAGIDALSGKSDDN